MVTGALVPVIVQTEEKMSQTLSIFLAKLRNCCTCFYQSKRAWQRLRRWKLFNYFYFIFFLILLFKTFKFKFYWYNTYPVYIVQSHM